MSYTETQNRQVKPEEGLRFHGPAKSATRIIRALHRDIGFLLIGLTIVYCLSGIVLVYRDKGLFTTETTVETTIAPGLSGEEIGKALKISHFQVTAEDGNLISFRDGVYDSSTGTATVTKRGYPEILDKLNGFHKQSSGSIVHIFSIIYGILLLFLALSSFWMYKAWSKPMKRGIILSIGGAVLTIVVILV